MTTTAPIQTKLAPLDREARAPKPLLSINAAAAFIGSNHDGDDVLELIDLGLIAWAWNIGSKKAERREVRVLLASVQFYARTGGKGIAPEFSWEQVLGMVLPDGGGKPVYENARLMRRWSASSELGLDLLWEKCLRVAPGCEWGRGRNGSPLFTRESVVEFLKSRRME
jgi:hypothetical protein